MKTLYTSQGIMKGLTELCSAGSALLLLVLSISAQLQDTSLRSHHPAALLALFVLLPALQVMEQTLPYTIVIKYVSAAGPLWLGSTKGGKQYGILAPKGALSETLSEYQDQLQCMDESVTTNQSFN